METHIENKPKRFLIYLSTDAGGRVLRSTRPTAERLEPLISAQPKVGERIGGFTVVAIGPSGVKEFPKVEAVRLENFRADDPQVSQDKRMEWVGRTYGRGIGLLEEADGIGGACTLFKYEVK